MHFIKKLSVNVFKVILIAHSFFFSLQLKSLHDQWLLLINTYHIDSLRIVRGDITSMVDVRAWCDQSELGFEITWLVVMILTLFRVYVLMESSYISIDNYKNVAESGIKHSSFLGINCDIRVHVMDQSSFLINIIEHNMRWEWTTIHHWTCNYML